MARTARNLLSSRSSFSLLSPKPTLAEAKPSNPSSTVLLGFNRFSTSRSCAGGSRNGGGSSPPSGKAARSMKDAALLEKLRMRRLQGEAKAPDARKSSPPLQSPVVSDANPEKGRAGDAVPGFRELGLSEDVMRAVEKTGMAAPSEIQCVGVPAVLERKSLLLSSPPGSGKTLAYLLPLIQLLGQEEALLGKQTKPRCPRAVVLLPTGEQAVQAYCMAKFFTSDVQFRPVIVSDEGQPIGQENSAEVPVDMVIGTPDGVLKYIEEGNIDCADIHHLVLDQMDSMYDSGLSPRICKFLGFLDKCVVKSCKPEFQAILVTGPIMKMLGKRLDPFVQHLGRDHSGEVAAMLLELDQTEVIHLIESPDALKDKVAEALSSLSPPASGPDNEHHVSSSSP